MIISLCPAVHKKNGVYVHSLHNLVCDDSNFGVLSYSGGRQKQKVVPADQNSGSQQQLHLAPCRDLTPTVTLRNCLTLLWTAGRQQKS